MFSRVSRITTVALLLGLTLSPVRSYAEPSAQDVTLAETLFQDAKRLMQEKNFAEACPKFAESHNLDPAGGTVLNLAVCDDQAGLTASAWSAYSEALIYARRENRDDRIATIEERLRALEARLSKVTVRVEEPRDDLAVELDGSPVRKAAWSVAMPINPGPHRLHASAPGFEEFSSDFQVPREKSDLKVTIPALKVSKNAPAPAIATPAPAATPADASTSPSADSDPGKGKRTTGLVLGGAGLVFVGVGSYFGVKALQQMSDSEDACPNDHCSADGAEKSADANTSANIANVGIGVGLVAIGLGTYFFVKGSQESSEKTARRTLVVPVVSKNSGGLVFRTSL